MTRASPSVVNISASEEQLRTVPIPDGALGCSGGGTKPSWADVTAHRLTTETPSTSYDINNNTEVSAYTYNQLIWINQTVRNINIRGRDQSLLAMPIIRKHQANRYYWILRNKLYIS